MDDRYKNVCDEMAMLGYYDDYYGSGNDMANDREDYYNNELQNALIDLLNNEMDV